MATMTTTQGGLKALENTVIKARKETLDLDGAAYSSRIDMIREREYPMLQDTTYLDHAGTALYAKSLVESFTSELTKGLFGNPHSASASSQLSSRIVDDARLDVLKFVNANPEHFDVVFLANATAAIKLVADAFRDNVSGFWYGYHADSHTSLVGARELAERGSVCFPDDNAVQDWIGNLEKQGLSQDQLTLFAYPGQSNMTGRRLPFEWCRQIRGAVDKTKRQAYSLLDAAALASTTPMDFSDERSAPDFTAVSFYKIFGFPDLGALIVRKESASVLRGRKYFAGGNVDMVSVCEDNLRHMKKETLHAALEDGTLPFHNIVALNQAFKVHRRLYGSMHDIAKHTGYLSSVLCDRLKRLRHSNGLPVCKIHGREQPNSAHGPVIAFNLLDSTGKYISNIEVEKLAVVRNIHLRTGGLCNPGGIARHLNLKAKELEANYAAGRRCGGQHDIMNGKPTGVIRTSLGAMSNSSDVDRLLSFLQEFFVHQDASSRTSKPTPETSGTPRFFIDGMSVFPIKSCAAFKVPAGIDWSVSAKGLAYDREWCLLHQGTNTALNQKQWPRMALIQPEIDIKKHLLTVSFVSDQLKRTVQIDLDDLPTTAGKVTTCRPAKQTQSIVCGESVTVYVYAQREINDFFSEVLEVPCVLARYPHIGDQPRYANLRKPKSKIPQSLEASALAPTIKLSNESPILLISRSSVNRLNQQVQFHHPSAPEIPPESFRANIIVSETRKGTQAESPYIEDSWKELRVLGSNASSAFDVLGPCQRCQMVCVDQKTATKRPEPFSTLAKTRRWDGGVWFGMHLCLKGVGGDGLDSTGKVISSLRIGDCVIPS